MEQEWWEFDWLTFWSDPEFDIKRPNEDAAFMRLYAETRLALNVSFRTSFSRFEQKVFKTEREIIENHLKGRDCFSSTEITHLISNRLNRSYRSIEHALERITTIMTYRNHIGLDPIPEFIRK